MASFQKRRRRNRLVGRLMDLAVGDIAPGGWGIGAFEGKRVHIRGGVPGDRVRARVVRQERGRIEARVEQVVSEGRPRIPARCEHFSVCGGCLWQDLAYEDQLNLKKKMVQFCFREAGLAPGLVADVAGSESVFFYRNKMDFTFGRNAAGEPALGLFEAPDKTGRSRKRGRMPPVFDVVRCWLQSEVSNRVVEVARTALKDSGLGPFEPNNGSGTVRSVVVREGWHTREMLVNVMAAQDSAPEFEQIAGAVMGAADEVTGVVLSLNPKRSKNALPQAQRALKGGERICEQISGLEVEVSSSSFLQVNTPQAEKLYQIAVDFAGLTGREQVLDLYCGTGTLSMLLARQAAEVTGVEINARAVADAKRNRARNGVANCRFLCKDVLEVLTPEMSPLDVVTVNPPRAGVFRRVIQAICQARPERVVYVSCNPETLSRDLVRFQQGGFRVEQVQPVDLFPHTPHCEVVVGLQHA